MMRLTGLPKAEHYPEAAVTRGKEAIQIRFLGEGDEQTMIVPLKYVGGDAEEAEFLLLAQLQEIGYRVRRDAPATY